MLGACAESPRAFETANGLDGTEAQSNAGGSDAGPGTPNPDTTSDETPSPSVGTAPVGDAGAPASQTVTSFMDASSLPQSDCLAKEYDALSILEPAEFPGVRNIYFYGDGVTTACVTHRRDKVCIEGNAPSSSDGTDDFQYWGMGLGMYLAVGSAPFDAPSQGIQSVRFSLTNVTGRSVRIAITQIPDPNITEATQNYPSNAFVYGGSENNDVGADTVVTAPLSEFLLPNWTRFIDPVSQEPAAGQPLDSSQLASLQVQIVNAPNDPPRMFTYCVSQLEWLDANGTPVVPVIPSETQAE